MLIWHTAFKYFSNETHNNTHIAYIVNTVDMLNGTKYHIRDHYNTYNRTIWKLLLPLGALPEQYPFTIKSFVTTVYMQTVHMYLTTIYGLDDLCRCVLRTLTLNVNVNCNKATIWFTCKGHNRSQRHYLNTSRSKRKAHTDVSVRNS